MNTISMMEYAMETRLIGRPHLPNVQGPQGISFFPNRRRTSRVMGRRYEV